MKHEAPKQDCGKCGYSANITSHTKPVGGVLCYHMVLGSAELIVKYTYPLRNIQGIFSEKHGFDGKSAVICPLGIYFDHLMANIASGWCFALFLAIKTQLDPHNQRKILPLLKKTHPQEQL